MSSSNFYAEWLKQNASENEQLLKQLQGGSDAQTNGATEQETKPTEISYKSDKFKLIIEEKHHTRQKMFKVQDALFIVRLIPLTNEKSPLLVDLLNFLNSGFEEILKKLKKFFQPSEHRIAYLTLYQEPMINGLNSGGFDLHDATGSNEIVSHILNMLYNYLNSNETLTLNESFKLYITILSIAHENFKRVENRKHKKRTAQFYASKKIRVGKFKSSCNAKYKWLLDVPENYFNCKIDGIFKNKCLVLAFALALLQHAYFENTKINKTFLYVQNINSKDKRRQTHAGNLLLTKFYNIIDETHLPSDGPYDLHETMRILHTHYQTQFFLFSSIASKKKLVLMYPSNYDDTLKPVYLYQPFNNKNHVIFIRNIKTFHKSQSRTCFTCLKSFSTINYSHLCPKKETCFACRRYFRTINTYINSKLIEDFCDKLISNEPYRKCSLCNITLYSEHCANGHKRICNGKGYFGWKCDLCNKFTYRYRMETSADIRNLHVCGTQGKCRHCFEPQSENHLCNISKATYPKERPRLAFLSIIFFPNLIDQPFLISSYVEKDYNLGLFNCQLLSEIPEIIPNASYTVKLTSFQYEKLLLQKQKKEKDDFTEHVNQLYRKEKWNLTNQLLCHLLRQHNTTFICNDQTSSIMMYLLGAFTSHGFCPKVIRNLRKINLLVLENINLRILSINFYLQNANENELAEAFGISFDPIFFPFHYFDPSNFTYEGKIPHLQYFLNQMDSSTLILAKTKFVKEYQEKNCKWNFAKEIVTFSIQKIELLILSVTKFINECYSLQQSLGAKEYLHPFSIPLCTLGGFIYKLFRLISLNKHDIRIVQHEFGFPRRKISQIEYDWAEFLCYKNPEKEYRGSLNHKDGAKYFKFCIPDLYSDIDKSILFLNGCLFHGHYDDCKLYPQATENSLTPWGQSYKSLNDSFWIKIQNTLLNYDEVESATVYWECTFNEMKKTMEYEKFMKDHYKPHPLVRLTSRDSFRGALCDVFCFRWTQSAFPDEQFCFYDTNSLYSYCAMNFEYMVGPYEIILGPHLNNVTIKDNKFYYCGKKISGAILLTILAPQDLLHPFLLYRTKNQESVLALCRTCAELKLQQCFHNETERAFTGTYMISEIEFALELNYKILFIFECHAYFESAYLFKDFVTELSKLKICNSISKKNVTDELCTELNCTSKDFSLNLFKRKFYKMAANALFGKIGQRNDKNKIIYVSSQEELEKLYFSENLIKDIFILNENICQIEIQPNTRQLVPNRNANCYLGAQLTAYARQTTYKSMEKIVKTPTATLYYVDCDSIVFSVSKNFKFPPLPLSFKCGDFKEEYEGISSFYSLGRKSYFISYISSNCPQKITKIKGLSLKNSSEVVAEELFDSFLQEYLDNKLTSIKIPQTRHFLNYKEHKVKTKNIEVSFSNNITPNRKLEVTSRVSTKPFGFI